MIIIDTVTPGSYMAFEAVEKSPEPITATVLSKLTNLDSAVLGKLNSQMYALMMVKMGGRAENLMRSVDHRQGWRPGDSFGARSAAMMNYHYTVSS